MSENTVESPEDAVTEAVSDEAERAGEGPGAEAGEASAGSPEESGNLNPDVGPAEDVRGPWEHDPDAGAPDDEVPEPSADPDVVLVCAVHGERLERQVGRKHKWACSRSTAQGADCRKSA